VVLPLQQTSFRSHESSDRARVMEMGSLALLGIFMERLQGFCKARAKATRF